MQRSAANHITQKLGCVIEEVKLSVPILIALKNAVRLSWIYTEELYSVDASKLKTPFSIFATKESIACERSRSESKTTLNVLAAAVSSQLHQAVLFDSLSPHVKASHITCFGNNADPVSY